VFGIFADYNIHGHRQGIHLRERHPVSNKTVCLMTVPDPENNPEPEGDVDPFEELGVQPTPTGAQISDGLEAFMDDDEEEVVEIETKVEDIELSEEEDDDDDLFATLGVAGPAVALSSSGEEDILSAFMDDDEEESIEPEATSPEPTPKPTPKPQANAKESYRMVLETVWVDGILDPGEVNLLARKREDLGISFEEHLALVRDMLG
jgi:hypothetical protein